MVPLPFAGMGGLQRKIPERKRLDRLSESERLGRTDRNGRPGDSIQLLHVPAVLQEQGYRPLLRLGRNRRDERTLRILHRQSRRFLGKAPAYEHRNRRTLLLRAAECFDRRILRPALRHPHESQCPGVFRHPLGYEHQSGQNFQPRCRNQSRLERPDR